MITNLYFKSKKSYVPFVPTDIAGCQLWLKADAGITKDGNNYVSQWADQSGNNNHAVQATGSAQPLWVDNQLNGNPTLRFNGSSNNMKLPNSCMPVREHTVIVVFKCTKSAYSIMFGSVYGNNALVVDINYSIGGCLSYFVSNSETRNDCGTNHRFDDSNYYYVICKYDNSIITYKTNDDVQPYMTINKTGNIVYHSANQAAIGSMLSTGGAAVHFHQGDIAEIIMYNNAIGSADNTKLEAYLDNKYGL